MVQHLPDAPLLHHRIDLLRHGLHPSNSKGCGIKPRALHATFRTIASHRARADIVDYDVLVIDECSTVSNTDLLKILEATNFKLLVLVGDVFQIESIRFGNWFNVIRSFIPKTAVFELTTPYRTTDASLLSFWGKVRNIEPDITESIARNGYSARLNASLFVQSEHDEIILALNYDGLYGINNINRFLQARNPNRAVTWGAATYKVDDPVIFTDSERFRPVIYNNLKGRIVAIQVLDGSIQFDVELDRPVTELEVDGFDLEWVTDSTVRFSVYDFDVSDEDDDTNTTVVPFQVAYAVSIHKAQGLEFDSVKVVITHANEDDITHNIFYTAVTRARQSLKLYWSPETQEAVISALRRPDVRKDVSLLSARRGLKPVAG